MGNQTKEISSTDAILEIKAKTDYIQSGSQSFDGSLTTVIVDFATPMPEVDYQIKASDSVFSDGFKFNPEISNKTVNGFTATAPESGGLSFIINYTAQ